MSRPSGGLGCAGWIIGLVLVVIILSPIISYATRGDATIVVNEKAIKRAKGEDAGDKYLIYTDMGVYEITDSLWQLRFNSSDLYGKLREGKTYDCKVNGFRIPLFSSYKNLLSCEEAS